MSKGKKIYCSVGGSGGWAINMLLWDKREKKNPKNEGTVSCINNFEIGRYGWRGHLVDLFSGPDIFVGAPDVTYH